MIGKTCTLEGTEWVVVQQCGEKISARKERKKDKKENKGGKKSASLVKQRSTRTSGISILYAERMEHMLQ